MRHALGIGLCVSLLTLAACARPTTPIAHPVAPVEPVGKPVAVAKPVVRPKLEVVFALDTTGSMSDLIEGAKQKIWSIADQLASGDPSPELRIGLVAYRDRGDSYVTQHFPLTDDLDVVYQQLSSLRADGGGDSPESVNQALYEAVHQSGWSSAPGVYRTVFLVGDAPPHTDYPDDVQYQETVREAARLGIVINTVQCGEMSDTKPVWLAIANGSQGSYASIAQSGGMQQIAAPMDAEIDSVNAALSETVVPYGAVAKQESVRSKAVAASKAPAAASAARHAYLGKKGGELVTGGGDLVDDVKAGRVQLSSVRKDELPSELRALSPEAQQAELTRRGAEREQLKARLDTLVQERASYVKKEQEKRKAEGARDGFDDEVMKAVKSQAAERASVKY